jgi:hypothetical protein
MRFEFLAHPSGEVERLALAEGFRFHREARVAERCGKILGERVGARAAGQGDPQHVIAIAEIELEHFIADAELLCKQSEWALFLVIPAAIHVAELATIGCERAHRLAARLIFVVIGPHVDARRARHLRTELRVLVMKERVVLAVGQRASHRNVHDRAFSLGRERHPMRVRIDPARTQRLHEGQANRLGDARL